MKQTTLERIALGCSFIVGTATFALLLSPCLIVAWLLYPPMTMLWTLLLLSLSALIAYRILRKVYQDMDTENCSKIERLKAKYPDIWRRVVREHFKRPFIPFLRDALGGRATTAEEKFLKAVELMESMHSSPEMNR